MYKRALYKNLIKSKKSILLLGPRQVGKSTLIKSLTPDLTINLAREDEYFSFQTNHSELEERISAVKNITTVFIDEVQRIPRILNTVQAIVDENPKIKFYLTGSSARKLRKDRANLLPGRVFTYSLAPLSALEIVEDWNETSALRFGTLPGVYSLKDEHEQKKLLQSYANTYLKEEILAETLLRGIDGFARFLREAAIYSGSFLDLSKLSKKAKIPRQSAVRHFEVLEDTLIVQKIENDPDLSGFDLVKHPRYFFFDLGVCNAIRGGFDSSGDRIGPLFEHHVFCQLKNTALAFDQDLQIFNLRTRGGFEVDYILKLNAETIAVECKSATHIDESDLKNLHGVDRFYKKTKKFLIYRGKVEKKIKDIWCLPLEKFLKNLFE